MPIYRKREAFLLVTHGHTDYKIDPLIYRFTYVFVQWILSSIHVPWKLDLRKRIAEKTEIEGTLYFLYFVFTNPIFNPDTLTFQSE